MCLDLYSFCLLDRSLTTHRIMQRLGSAFADLALSCKTEHTSCTLQVPVELIDNQATSITCWNILSSLYCLQLRIVGNPQVEQVVCPQCLPEKVRKGSPFKHPSTLIFTHEIYETQQDQATLSELIGRAVPSRGAPTSSLHFSTATATR